MSEILPARRWKPEIRIALEEMILEDRDAPPVATLDWDNTCMGGDVSEAVLVALDEEDGGNRFETYLDWIDTRGKVTAYTYCATAIHGLTEAEAADFSAAVIDRELARGRLEELPEIRDLIDAMQRSAWEVWIVSAAPEIAIRVAAARYGITSDRVIGVRLTVDERGALTQELDGPLTYREGKVEAIDANIGRRPTFAAGDAETDIEMLEASSRQLVLDRGNAELATRARTSQWWVQPAWSAK